MSEQDFLKKHDTQLTTELNRFYSLTNTQENKGALLQLRDTVIDRSEDYKNTVYEMRGFVAGKLGSEPVAAQPTSINKLVDSIDALLYRDLLDNKGKEYDSLMEKRDGFTAAQDSFNKSLSEMVNESDRMETQFKSGTKLDKVISEIRKTIEEGDKEKTAEVER